MTHDQFTICVFFIIEVQIMQDRKIVENIQIIYKNINKQLVQLVLQTPVPRLQTPDSNLQTPDSSLHIADSSVHTVDGRLQTPGSRLQSPDSRLQAIWLAYSVFNVLNFDLFLIVCAKLNILVTFSVFLRLLGDASCVL